MGKDGNEVPNFFNNEMGTILQNFQSKTQNMFPTGA